MAPRPYYEEGGIVIFHGDAREILPGLEAREGWTVTDPPFGIGDAPITGRKPGGKRPRGGNNDYHPPSPWDLELPDFSILPTPCAMFGNWRKRPAVEAMISAPIRTEIIWAKDMHTGPPCPVARQDERIWVFSEAAIKPTRFETSIWNEAVIPTWGHRHHKNEKPIALMKRLISWLSESGRVVDPFMGSGTTLRAAKDLGRPAVGIEISERYCEIAADRLCQGVLDL